MVEAVGSEGAEACGIVACGEHDLRSHGVASSIAAVILRGASGPHAFVRPGRSHKSPHCKESQGGMRSISSRKSFLDFPAVLTCRNLQASSKEQEYGFPSLCTALIAAQRKLAHGMFRKEGNVYVLSNLIQTVVR